MRLCYFLVRTKKCAQAFPLSMPLFKENDEKNICFFRMVLPILPARAADIESWSFCLEVRASFFNLPSQKLKM